MHAITGVADRLRGLLESVACEKRRCKFCNAPLYFVRVKSGAIVPYTEAGINHFTDCSNFRKPDARQGNLLDTAPAPKEAF